MENIAEKLPKRPTALQMSQIQEAAEADICHFGWYEPVTVMVDILDTGYECFTIGSIGSGRKKRAAAITCPHCGEVMIAGWVPGGEVQAIVGDDGIIYDGIPGGFDGNMFNDDYGECGCIRTFKEYDAVDCRMCGESFFIKRRSKVKDELISRCAVNTMEEIDGNLCIVTWMAENHHHRNMSDDLYKIHPEGAVVLTKDRRLKCFRMRGNEYKQLKNFCDFSIKIYNSYEATCGRKVGSANVVNREAIHCTLADRTGLEEYIDIGGTHWAIYLRNWRAHKNIEALVKSAAGTAVRDCIRDRCEGYAGWSDDMTGFPFEIDFKQSKPEKMLGFNRTEWAYLVGMTDKNHPMTADKIARAQIVKEKGCAIERYAEIADKIGEGKASAIILLTADGNKYPSLERAMNYLRKQKMYSISGVEILMDYWKAIVNLQAAELFFPRDLRQAHEFYCVNRDGVSTEAEKMNFIAVSEECAALQYRSGEYIITVCPNTDELTKESNTLHHCVRTYVKSHIAMTSVVFFVRHRRRPERSFYTTDYNLTAKIPHRNQLHGYKNDRYRKVPQEILDFLKEWEQKVLLPWAAENNKKSLKEAV